MISLLRRGILGIIMADIEINEIKTVTTSGITTDVSLTDSIDLTKSIVVITDIVNATDSDNVNNTMVTCAFFDDSTVRLEMDTFAVLTVQFIVITFNKAISVNFYSASFFANPELVAISSVDRAGNDVRTFQTSRTSANASASTAQYHAAITLTSDTEASLSRGGSGGTNFCEFFVVELP